jgi:riboflavin synthase
LKFVFSTPEDLSPLIAPKGSVAIDGVSLTVNETKTDSFTINVIPHTLSLTTLSTKKQDQAFNLEVDILARYIKRLLEASAIIGQNQGPKSESEKKPSGGLSLEDLISQGF